ncbi:MAG: flavodoxin family protein [Thermoleophilia bacterium]|nr:flavodoxin family protein [Thermoleophilia bacterium]
MKILGVVGSPRRGGNTHLLVTDALEAAGRAGAETRLVMLRDHVIEGCRGCEGCATTHRCVIKDDMQSLYPLMLEADGLVLGSPAYFYNVSSLVKSFLERCYCLEAFDPNDRSCWVGVPEAMGGACAVVIAVGEQAEEQYLGHTIEAMSLPLADLGYRVVAKVKACGLWSAGDAGHAPEIGRAAARAGELLVRTIRLRKALAAQIPEGSRAAPGD